MDTGSLTIDVEARLTQLEQFFGTRTALIQCLGLSTSAQRSHIARWRKKGFALDVACALQVLSQGQLQANDFKAGIAALVKPAPVLSVDVSSLHAREQLIATLVDHFGGNAGFAAVVGLKPSSARTVCSAIRRYGFGPSIAMVLQVMTDNALQASQLSDDVKQLQALTGHYRAIQQLMAQRTAAAEVADV